MLDDMRVISFIFITLLMVIGILVALAFTFSLKWILIPFGVLYVLWALFSIIITGINII
jgi:hypothetical protein